MLVLLAFSGLAGHQQHRQAAAENIVHAVCGIGGADIDMDQHALTATRHQGIARGHMRRGIFVRTPHHTRHRLAAFAAMRDLIDDRGVIGSEIAEQVIDADLGQALEQEIGRGEFGNIGLVSD